MLSNDPQTPRRALCYFCDPSMDEEQLGFVSFSQFFRGINSSDIYASEFKRPYQINMLGIDGLVGPFFVGSNCFFRRRVFFGPPRFISSEIREVGPNNVNHNNSIKDPRLLELAHNAAGCNYENMTNWGSKMGFRYGTLVEDFFTSFQLHCEGWKSISCNPTRPAFLGNVPNSLNDVLVQVKRVSVGFLEVGFCKLSTLTYGYGLRSMNSPLAALGYSHYSFCPILAIPITIYAFIPQFALLKGFSIFPKVSDFWFLLYAFLFLGSYGQDYLEFILEKSTLRRWWNDQRMWLVKGVSSFLFGLMEYTTKHLGFAQPEFIITSKSVDDEQNKRYDQGKFEFGVASPLFVPLAMVALINLAAFLFGLVNITVSGGKSWDVLFVQMFIAGFGILNCLPIYEAMFLRSDEGKMPTKITIIGTILAWTLYLATSLTLG